MGMNYYCRRIPTKEDKQKLYELVEQLPTKDELVQMIDDNRLEELRNMFENTNYDIQRAYEDVRVKVHLGKSSYGWQFLWAHNPEYYEDTLESIKAFVTQQGWEIVNEEYEVLTYDQLMERIGAKIYKTDDLFDLPSYYEWERKQGKRHYQLGLNTEYTTADGLRFCTDADFC